MYILLAKVESPLTPNVLPIVVELLTVNAETVVFPLEPTVVNNALLGVTLPIGVDCSPPNALSVVIAVIDVLLVIAAAVTLPVALNVDTIAVLPPATPNVPFNGPFTVPLAVTVAPVMAAPVLPIVVACSVVPFNVPLRVNPVSVPTDVILFCAAVLNVPVRVALTLPIVAALIVVPVNVPVALNDVNAPELAVTLPIGVFCKPPYIVKFCVANNPDNDKLDAVTLPVTPNVPPIVAELLTVNASTVALPVVLSVETIAVLPPADPNVPFSGPLNELLAEYVAPVNTADALPIVAA